LNVETSYPVTSIAHDRAREIFERFKSTTVLVLGDVMLDVYVWGSVDRISPEAPVPVMKVTDESVMFGGAANVAANIAALGGIPVLAGVVGDDEAGRDLKARLSAIGLRTDCIVLDNSRPTTRKTRVLANQQQIVRVDRERNDDISESVAEKLVRAVGEALTSSDALLLQDYNKGVLTTRVIESAVSAARQEKKIITVDPKYRNFFEYRGVTLFKPNVREMEYAFGASEENDRRPEKMMEDLRKRIDSRFLLLTCGESGMVLLSDDGGISRIPAVCREVYDVSGAGDTVISTVTLGLASGATALESAILANFAAGVEIQRSGARTVSQEDVVTAMQRYGGTIEQ